MVDAAKPPIDPPAHVRLRDGDRPFWDGIVRARARDEWCESDLVVAAQLARREMALMRTLRMGGRVAGDARDEAGRRRIQRQAEAARAELEDDELLA